MRTIKVLFNVVQNYYWPAMEPIYKCMAADPRYEISLRIGPNQVRFLGIFLLSQKEKIAHQYRQKGFTVTDEKKGFDIVICGDTFPDALEYGNALLCNVDHGPCFKSLRYRNLLKQPEVRYIVCAEGPYRLKKLKEHGLDKRETVIDVGLPKLDPFFDGTYSRETIVKRHDLDPDKKIVLYAPTYKPTSIFMVAPVIHRLLDTYNVVVKLHPYSWSGKYASHRQHRIFEEIAGKYPKLVLVDPSYHDIMPYLFSADTMISEASSVINEFLALDRAGIIMDLEDERLKHHDGQPLLEEKTTDWLKDSFIHCSNAEMLVQCVKEAVEPSETRRNNLKRDREYMYSFTDSKCSQRVKDALEELLGTEKR